MDTNVDVLEDAIVAGLNFVMSHQSENGSWTDWALPPGSSSTWTTAYIGYKLNSIPEHLKSTITPHLIKAAHWLLKQRSVDGGWGYNELTGPDADSTAFTILFLNSVGQQIPEVAYFHLTQYQCSDGGFATYLARYGQGSWIVSHPDVTPIALLALLTHPCLNPQHLARGISYVLSHKDSNWIWQSFWWNSFLYATEANFALLNSMKLLNLPRNLPPISHTNAFETSLLISILLYANLNVSNQMIDSFVTDLLNQQQPDGSWESVPILRVTHRDCLTPWESENSGSLFSDSQRLFTTATALCVLAKLFTSKRPSAKFNNLILT